MGIDGDSNRVPDYVLVGHAARDVFGTTSRLGGTVLYAGATAARLGRRVGIVTAGAVPLTEDAALVEAAVETIPSIGITTFEYAEGAGKRSLRLIEQAVSLTASAVPPAWRSADIVHLAPIADELPRNLAAAFHGATVVATPQGWMRSFAPDGTVRPAPERALRLPLERFAAIVVSAEDLAGDLDIARAMASRLPALAVTRGADGCSIYRADRVEDVPAFSATAVDTIGAGDVFAAAFFIRLRETDDAVESARFASAAAALSVEGVGTSRIPDRNAIAERLSGESACIE